MELVRNTACAVPECEVPQWQVSGLKIHKFPDPKEKSRRAAFLRFCRIDSDPGGKLIICSSHFPDEAYQLAYRMLDRDRRDWKLNRDAVPTLFPPPGYVPEEVEITDIAEEQATMDTDPISEDSIEEEEIVNELEVVSHQCRLCLEMVDADDSSSVNLFDITTNAGDSLSGELLEMFQLLIEPSPQWPSIACNKCVNFMHQIRRFKEQIMTSHRVLYKEIVQEAMNEEESETEIQQEDLPEELQEFLNEFTAGEGEDTAQEKMVIESHPRRPSRDLDREEELEDQMSEMKLLYCGECDAEEFDTLQDLHLHQQTEHKLQSGYISCCKMKFCIYKAAYDHMEYHRDPERFKCSDCDESLMSNALLLHHMIYKHPQKHQCRTCGKMLATVSRLRKHEATHLPIEQRPFKCGYCPKGFTSAANLKRHVERMHEIEERHICEVCGRSFSNAGTLWQHVEDHKKRKTTRTRSKLKMSVEEALEMLNCLYCSQEVQRGDMSSHTRRIHNRFFMECRICRIQFKSCGNFKEHKDRHNNVVFKCDFCDKICNNGQGKRDHTKKHHPEEFQLRQSRRKVPKSAE